MPLRDIPGPGGRLEALLDEPAALRHVGASGLLAMGSETGVRAAVVFAHPHTEYGGTMHTKVVYQAAKALSRIGCAVLRFNFRGAGASDGAFSNGPGEMDDMRAAVDFMSGSCRRNGRRICAPGCAGRAAWKRGAGRKDCCAQSKPMRALHVRFHRSSLW